MTEKHPESKFFYHHLVKKHIAAILELAHIIINVFFHCWMDLCSPRHEF